MSSQVEAIKWVPGTAFTVDGFRFQHPACKAYFLTHAHSDHTTGLTQAFCAGPIYCSPITARLLRCEMGIRPDLLRILPLDQPTTVCGVEVTALDANHCPGACMLLFRVPVPEAGGGGSGSDRSSKGQAATTTVLHTGDLRWHGGMAEHPALAGRHVDVLMLDTTYCQPRWSFPPQDEAVQLMAQMLRQEVEAGPAGAVLAVVGSYHIGKERAYLGAAHALNWRVYCSPAKHKLLRLLGLPLKWLALLTDVPEQAEMHVLSMGEQLHPQALADKISGTQWQRVVAIKPTGWSWRPKGGMEVRREGCVTVVGIPYSEHSSFPELRDCVRALRPKRLIPTVNTGDATKSRSIVDRFADLMDLSADRSRLDCYLQRPLQQGQAEGLRGSSTGCQPLPIAWDRPNCGREGSLKGGSDVNADAGVAWKATGTAGDSFSAASTQDGHTSSSCWAGSCGGRMTAQHTPPIASSATTIAAAGGVEACEAVDLSSIDVAEQHCILAGIQASRSSSAKKRLPGSSTGLKQGSLKRFFALSGSQPLPN